MVIGWGVLRKAGFALREGLLLMDYELDQNGFMKPGTGKKFPLNASARDIGRSSVGMGVYLTSLQLFVVLNLLLGIFVGIPLMVMNGVESNFTDEFLVRVNGQDQVANVLLLFSPLVSNLLYTFLWMHPDP